MNLELEHTDEDFDLSEYLVGKVDSSSIQVSQKGEIYYSKKGNVFKRDPLLGLEPVQNSYPSENIVDTFCIDDNQRLLTFLVRQASEFSDERILVVREDKRSYKKRIFIKTPILLSAATLDFSSILIGAYEEDISLIRIGKETKYLTLKNNKTDIVPETEKFIILNSKSFVSSGFEGIFKWNLHEDDSYNVEKLSDINSPRNLIAISEKNYIYSKGEKIFSLENVSDEWKTEEIFQNDSVITSLDIIDNMLFAGTEKGELLFISQNSIKKGYLKKGKSISLIKKTDKGLIGVSGGNVFVIK